jgi:hypothetical protein
MAYIGKQPVVGNFVKLDAITTSATATYNLLNGGVAYFPQTANNCIVSLNGVIQSPTSAYTISGSTIVFSDALTASDTIDFILVLGDVLSIGTPSDGTVGFAKVTSNLITGATAETSIADADTLLIYDDSATALRKMTKANFVSGIGGVNTPAFFAHKSTSQTFSDATSTKIQFDLELFDSDNKYDNATNYRFTPTAGKYFIFGSTALYSASAGANHVTRIVKNGTTIAYQSVNYETNNIASNAQSCVSVSTIDTANGTDYYEIFAMQNNSGGGTVTTDYNTTERYNYFGAYKLIGA